MDRYTIIQHTQSRRAEFWQRLDFPKEGASFAFCLLLASLVPAAAFQLVRARAERACRGGGGWGWGWTGAAGSDASRRVSKAHVLCVRMSVGGRRYRLSLPEIGRREGGKLASLANIGFGVKEKKKQFCWEGGVAYSFVASL